MGSSKKQTVGYKMMLSMHAIFVHGPVDFLRRLQWDKRDAWVGENAGGSIAVNAPSLFGGEEREGGVSGTVHFMPGGPAQGRNAHLQSLLGTDIPAFRKVAGLVFENFYFGMNPYLKPVNARMQRIHLTTDGAVQWYDEKAEIHPAASAILAGPWQYKIIPMHSDPGHTNLTPPTEWDGEVSPPLSSVWPMNTPPGWPTPQLSIMWLKKTVYNVPAGLVIQLRADNGCVLWVNGEYVGASNINNVPISSNQNNPVEFTVPVAGTYEILGKAYAEESAADQGGNVISVTLDAIPSGGDMNPAHILRECLTDPDWGMGYLAADIDDTSFTACADTLYAEGMGISLLWDRQIPLEDFIKEILRHINATLYVSRSTGKFVLKLIRNDYDVESLLVLGEDEIERVENYSFQAFGEMVNSVTVNYWDKATNTTASITEQDPALVQMQGCEINTTLQYPGFTYREIAGRVALRDLQTLSTPLRSCTVFANTAAKDLNIGDVFVMDWPDFGEPVVMRVLGMALGDGKSNKVRMSVTQDAFSLPGAAVSDDSGDGWEDPISAPAAASPRKVMEAPYRELIQILGEADTTSKLESLPELGYLLTMGARPNASAVNYLVSTDSGAGYTEYPAADFCPCATLGADIGKPGAGTTTVAIENGKDLDLVELNSLCAIGDELAQVTALSDTSVTLARAVLDTVPAEHVTGTPIFFFDDFSGTDAVEYTDTDAVDVKMITVSGAGKLDEATAPVDTVTMQGRAVRPYPPGNVVIDGSYWPAAVDGIFVVTWAHRNRVSQQDMLVPFTSGDVTPADNTRYGLRFLDASLALLVERTDIGPGTATVELNYTGDVTMELYTIDNNGESLQRHSHTFAYSGGTTTNIDATAYTPVDDTTIIDGGDLDG